MGMAMVIFAVREDTLRRLRDDPPLVWQLIAPDDPEPYEEARAGHARSRGGFWTRLFGRAPATSEAATLALEAGEGLVADLDKAWHGLHYLFTRSAEAGDAPMDFLAVGGEAIGDVDVGYGPARSLAPATVRDIAQRLAALTDEELSARFNPADMLAKQIYPDIWGRDPKEDDALGYLLTNLGELRAGVAQAVERGFGLVVVLQ